MSSRSHNLSVLFADVGSTRLYERLGDTNAFQAISTCLAEIERATKANKGRVVKTIEGTRVELAVFPCAEDAINAARVRDPAPRGQAAAGVGDQAGGTDRVPSWAASA